METIVLATRNPGKINEIRALLLDLPVHLVAASEFEGAPEPDETEPTLEGNARLKAEELFRFTGVPSLADDTGLEVNALNGAPGVISARYAGPEADPAANRALLLSRLDGISERTARFRTVIALAETAGVRLFEGVCEGTIIDEERGSGGFGYDAIFVPEGEVRTFAELSPEEKNRISHRGQALRAFATYLHERLNSPL